MKAKEIDIGIKVPIPTKECTDMHCPFHGGYKLRGRLLAGTVVRNVTQKTATLEFQRLCALPKYERYEKRRTRIKAHVPPCIQVNKGDFVRIAEGRKIAKTKSFVVIEVKK